MARAASGTVSRMAAIGSMLAVLHAWVAVAGAMVAVLLVVVGVLDGAGIGGARGWLDRLAAILFVTMVAAVLLGPGIVAGRRACRRARCTSCSRRSPC